jgi:hypothetical protein
VLSLSRTLVLLPSASRHRRKGLTRRHTFDLPTFDLPVFCHGIMSTDSELSHYSSLLPVFLGQSPAAPIVLVQL